MGAAPVVVAAEHVAVRDVRCRRVRLRVWWARQGAVGRRRHHHGGGRLQRARALDLCETFGAQAVEIHLALQSLQAQLLLFVARGQAAQCAIDLLARLQASGGLRIVEGLCRICSARGALQCGLALALGGLGLLALLLARDGFGGLLAFGAQRLGRLARLDLQGLAAAGAFAIGVGDLAGARVGAAQYLGRRAQAGQQRAGGQAGRQKQAHGGAFRESFSGWVLGRRGHCASRTAAGASLGRCARRAGRSAGVAARRVPMRGTTQGLRLRAPAPAQGAGRGPRRSRLRPMPAAGPGGGSGRWAWRFPFFRLRVLCRVARTAHTHNPYDAPGPVLVHTPGAYSAPLARSAAMALASSPSSCSTSSVCWPSAGGALR